MLALEPQKTQNIYNLLNQQRMGLNYNRECDLEACLNNVVHHRLMHNITQNNCLKTIYNIQNHQIVAFDVNGHLVATHSWNKTIKLWNLDTGACLWTFNAKHPLFGKIMLRIIEGKVVCAGFEKLDDQTTIRIIDIETGKETAKFRCSSEENSCICSKVCTIGNRIFTLDRNDIRESNLEGKLVRMIKMDDLLPASLFLGQGNFLVHISEKNITIHDLANNQNQNIKINSLEEGKSIISSAYINGDRLICGIQSKKNSKSSCCMIDLQNGEVCFRYPGKDKDGKLLYLPPNNKIKKIVASNEGIYFTDRLGGLFAINIAKNTHQVLGIHANVIKTLSLEGGVLVSASGGSFSSLAELKFWDATRGALLSEKKFDGIRNILFTSAKIFAVVEKSLIQWDYLVSHEGEKLTALSADEIERDPDARNCIVQ
ncbi:MAG TPA: WD40 repeat domain-containing protein [Parachlamydiaceae bacterium]|nr:WD40 repeat domain-containing protein [Parachlamydiaceae bacterium]